jgi:hypothetical protein
VVVEQRLGPAHPPPGAGGEQHPGQRHGYDTGECGRDNGTQSVNRSAR